MNQYIEEKSKSALFSQDNKQLYLYFIMPLLLGILLGDGLGIDISEITAKYIGILRFIKNAGIDIRTKSLIFILYLPFSLYYSYYIFNKIKLNPPPTYQVKTASFNRIFKILIGSLFLSFGTYLLIIMGPDESALVKPSRYIRLILTCAKWDISFAVFSGSVVWGGGIFVYASFILSSELSIRLKNRPRSIKKNN